MIDYSYVNMKANDIRSKYCLNTRPTDLTKILIGEGLKLETTDDQDSFDAYIEDGVIYVKNSQAIERSTFSIAHELGHWFLHDRKKSYDRNTSSSNHNKKDEEKEANAFAVELLMPYKEVHNKILHRWTINELMDHFRVSYEFASFRYSNVLKSMS